MKQTLSYSQRLHQREEFEGAFNTKALTEKWLAVYCERNTVGIDRLGVVVSKRIVPKAHQRNRLKRLIRECFRTSNLNQPSSLNVVVRLRKNVLPAETIELRQTMSRLLKKVRMTENDSPASIVHQGLSVSD